MNSTVGEPGLLHVRPAWDVGSPELSERALSLLLGEWRALGLLDEDQDADSKALLRGVHIAPPQRRCLRWLPSPSSSPRRLRLVADSAAEDPAADWASLEGVLLTYGETAISARDPEGRPVRERLAGGAIKMPADDGVVLLNRPTTGTASSAT